MCGAGQIDIDAASNLGFTRAGFLLDGRGSRTGVPLPDNGRNNVALLSLDLNQSGNSDARRARIQKEIGGPADNVMVFITHNHNAPMTGRPSLGGLAKTMGTEIDGYTSVVSDRVALARCNVHSGVQGEPDRRRLRPVRLAVRGRPARR